MLKLCGIIIFLIGTALLVYSLLNARKDGYREAKTELAMITSAGYATRHVEATRPEAVLNKTPVKAAPRQRTLSKEALDLLDLVEDEREKERIEEMNKPKKKGTDVFPSSKGKGTDILPKGGKKTDVMRSGSGTDVMQERKGTDIMSKDKGTDVMSGSGGTDVMTDRKGTDVMASAKTDTLIEKGKGTDILEET